MSAYRVGIGRVRPAGRLRRAGLWAPGGGGSRRGGSAGELSAPRAAESRARTSRRGPRGSGRWPARSPRASRPSIGRFSFREVGMPARRPGDCGRSCQRLATGVLWTRSDTYELM